MSYWLAAGISLLGMDVGLITGWWLHDKLHSCACQYGDEWEGDVKDG